MPAHPRSLALLFGIGILTGCAVGPDYRPPVTALSADFLGPEDVDHAMASFRALGGGWDAPHESSNRIHSDLLATNSR